MVAKLIIVGWTIWVGYAFLNGLANLEATHPSEGIATFAIIVSIIAHFFTWCLVGLPTYMISRMFRRRRDVIVMTPPAQAEPAQMLQPYMQHRDLTVWHPRKRPGFTAAQLK